jgi:hypothetical protein
MENNIAAPGQVKWCRRFEPKPEVTNSAGLTAVGLAWPKLAEKNAFNYICQGCMHRGRLLAIGNPS